MTRTLLPPPTAAEIAEYLRERIAKNKKEVAVGKREGLKSHERMCPTVAELMVVVAWIEQRS
jgi:hypothetical protein